MARIEKAKRNQTLSKYDVTNESTDGKPDDTNRGRGGKAGDFSTQELASKTFARSDYRVDE